MAGSTQGAVTAVVARPQGAGRPIVRAGAPAPTPRKELEAQRELRAMLPHLFPAAPPPAPTPVDVQKVLPWLSEAWPGHARPAEIEAAKAQIVDSMRGVLAEAGYAEPGALAVSPGVDAALERMVAAAVQAKKAGLGGLLTDTPVLGDPLHGVRRTGWAGKDKRPAPGPLPERLRYPLFDSNHLGFNAPRVLHYETTGEMKYGDTPNVLRDLATLGATYFRQPTAVDLTWPVDPFTNELARVPVESGHGELRAVLDRAGVTTNLTSLFQYLILQATDGEWNLTGTPLKVVLTFLNVQSPHGNIADPEDELWSPQRKANSNDTVVQLPWSGDHATKRITWWDGTEYAFDAIGGVYGAARTLSGAPGDGTVLFEGLDPRSPYKLMYVYLIARAFAEVLIEVDALIAGWWHRYASSPAPSIFDYILGIELCNEVNVKNLVIGPDEVVDLGASALLWMHVAWEGMRGFQEVLSGAGRTVDFWLPSLWSYPQAEPPVSVHYPQRFSDVLAFDSWLAALMALQAVYDATLRTPFVVDTRWVANQDYHFYHQKADSGAAILRLRAEITALRRALAVLGSDRFDAPSVSVSETGASTHGDDVAANYEWIALYVQANTPALGPAPVDDAALRRFQAREVWRRLAVATCYSATAAWHTHMANTNGPDDTGTFRDMGVRVDNQPDGDRTTAAQAGSRPAYWAYQRFTTLLRNPDTGDWHGRVVEWDRSEHATDDYMQGLDPADGGDMLVILEFDLGSGVSFADYEFTFRRGYLLFLDPCYTAIDRDYSDTAPVAVTPRIPAGATAVRLPTVPESISPGVGTSTTFPTDIPAVGTGDWSLGTGWTDAHSELNGRPLTIYVNGPASIGGVDQTLGDPVLILSTDALEFT